MKYVIKPQSFNLGQIKCNIRPFNCFSMVIFNNKKKNMIMNVKNKSLLLILLTLLYRKFILFSYQTPKNKRLVIFFHKSAVILPQKLYNFLKMKQIHKY